MSDTPESDDTDIIDVTTTTSDETTEELPQEEEEEEEDGEETNQSTETGSDEIIEEEEDGEEYQGINENEHAVGSEEYFDMLIDQTIMDEELEDTETYDEGEEDVDEDHAWRNIDPYAPPPPVNPQDRYSHDPDGNVLFSTTLPQVLLFLVTITRIVIPFNLGMGIWGIMISRNTLESRYETDQYQWVAQQIELLSFIDFFFFGFSVLILGYNIVRHSSHIRLFCQRRQITKFMRRNEKKRWCSYATQATLDTVVFLLEIAVLFSITIFYYFVVVLSISGLEKIYDEFGRKNGHWEFEFYIYSHIVMIFWFSFSVVVVILCSVTCTLCAFNNILLCGILFPQP